MAIRRVFFLVTLTIASMLISQIAAANPVCPTQRQINSVSLKQAIKDDGTYLVISTATVNLSGKAWRVAAGNVKASDPNKAIALANHYLVEASGSITSRAMIVDGFWGCAYHIPGYNYGDNDPGIVAMAPIAGKSNASINITPALFKRVM